MSDPVSRLNAALEGRYAIERELGEGGMATVYLADDLRHEQSRLQGWWKMHGIARCFFVRRASP